MKIIGRTKENDIANVFIGEINNKRLEFVESTQPPLTIKDKWVLILSTLYGCPVKCGFCDAGGNYKGKVSYDDFMKQTKYLINSKFPNGYVDSNKFKIQFARMGDPAFNMDVIRFLEDFPKNFKYKSFMPSVSTIAPKSCDSFFQSLLEVKNKHYRNGFQLQFSIHTTNEKDRDKLIPCKKLSFRQLGQYGEQFYNQGNRKITLNFALSNKSELSAKTLIKYFNPDKFLIKITPINPTYNAIKNKIKTIIRNENEKEKINQIIENLDKKGFETILSIGELEENQIGSNCGQYLKSIEKNRNQINQDEGEKFYTYL